MAVAAELRPSKRAPSQEMPEIAAFYDAMLAAEPFAINRVTDPSQMLSDVEPVNGTEFKRLVGLALRSSRHGLGFGALLLGGAGLGKSHMLARLARWAHAPEGSFDRACYVYLHNIQAPPERIGRYLLKCCVSKLVEDRLDRLHETPLFRLVNLAVRTLGKAERIRTLTMDNRSEVFETLCRRLGGDPSVFAVFFRFFCSVEWAMRSPTAASRRRHQRDAALAVRWLKGEMLDAADAERIGRRIPFGRNAVQIAEDQGLEVLLTLSRLARVAGRPLILCVDQFDSMQPARCTALCQWLHALADRAVNMLIVVSGVRETVLARIRDQTIPEAFADRLDRTRPVDLRRIDRGEARKILEDRLHDFLTPFEDVPEVKERFSSDPLFPLGSEWFESTNPEMYEFRPRDVITWADNRWTEIQARIRSEGAAEWLARWEAAATHPKKTYSDEQIRDAIDVTVGKKLEEFRALRQLRKSDLPASATNLVTLTKQLLDQCLQRPEKRYTITDVQLKGKQAVDLVVSEEVNGKTIFNAIQFVVTSSKTTAATQLRKLLTCEPADRRFLVTDEEREPLKLGDVGQQYLKKLQIKSSFQHIKLNFDLHARLDAMVSVLELARSGDLELVLPGAAARLIVEHEVIESFHRRNCYAQHPLLHDFITEVNAPELDPGICVDESQFRAFVLNKLALNAGFGLKEILKGFLAIQHGPDADLRDLVPKYMPSAKGIVQRMHSERIVFARVFGDDVMLEEPRNI